MMSMIEVDNFVKNVEIHIFINNRYLLYSSQIHIKVVHVNRQSIHLEKKHVHKNLIIPMQACPNSTQCIDSNIKDNKTTL